MRNASVSPAKVSLPAGIITMAAGSFTVPAGVVIVPAMVLMKVRAAFAFLDPRLNCRATRRQLLPSRVLHVSYTFAWDYPFSLRHQNTSVVLLTGKGTGPFSGPLGATSVASELVKALKPYRNN